AQGVARGGRAGGFPEPGACDDQPHLIVDPIRSTSALRPPCPTTSSNPCSTVFMNWCCVGFMAFTHSVKSRDWKMSYAFTAKCLNVCTLILGLLLIIVHIIILSTRSLMIIQAFTSS
ncbi:hypothetical protein Celaphus_00016409, partial [Cervus elaphus hippelaphus]